MVGVSLLTLSQAVPLALAENSGLPPIESLTHVKKRQLEENNPYLGIDCNDTGEAEWGGGAGREAVNSRDGRETDGHPERVSGCELVRDGKLCFRAQAPTTCASRTCSRPSSARSSSSSSQHRWAGRWEEVQGETVKTHAPWLSHGAEAQWRRGPSCAAPTAWADPRLRPFASYQVCKMILKIDDVIKPSDYE